MRKEDWLYRFSIVLCNKMSECDMTALKLSNISGIDVRSIYGYMEGLHVPNAYHVSCIADSLACSTDELIGFTYLYSIDDY